nr:Ger(x)C family spore germination protein [Metabacillus mangrovi]
MAAAMVILLASCGRVELNELFIVSGLGFDPHPDGLLMSFQVINPGGSAKSTGTSGGGGAGSAVYTYTISGSSITAIMEKARNMFSRKLYFSHLSVILAGEELAANNGLMPIMDYLERYYQFRDNVSLYVTRESSAKELLSVSHPIQNLPAVSMSRRLKTYGGSAGLSKGMEVQEFLALNYGGFTEPVVPGLKKYMQTDASDSSILNQIDGDQKMFEMTGFALFKNDKLAAWLTPEESRGWSLLTDKTKTFETSVECPGYPEKKIGLRFTETKGKLKSTSVEPLLFQGEVSASANIQEVTCPVRLEDPGELRKIEKAAEEKLKTEMQKAFLKMQEVNSDGFGLRQLLYENHYKEWKKMKKDWEKEFPEARLEASAHITLKLTGLRIKSIYEK